MRHGLMLARMMRFYKGAMTYESALAMPYKSFVMLYDYMLWQLRDETEDGRKINSKIERTDILHAFGVEGMIAHRRATQKDSFDKFRKDVKLKKKR